MRSFSRLTLRRVAYLLCASCLAPVHAWAIPQAAERFFTAPPRTLLEHAASFNPADTSRAICLLESMSWNLEDDGRLSTDLVVVHRVRTPAALASLGSVYQSWSPWYESKPVVRARVITSDGTEFLLDPSSLIEQQGATESAVEYSDERVVMGPLPRVAVGSIVVVQITRQEHRPFFSSGRSIRYQIGNVWPVLETHLEASVPRSASTRFVLLGFPNAKPVRSESRGRLTWRLSLPTLAPWPDLEPMMVPDSVSRPRFEFSTGVSWMDIAKEYRKPLPFETNVLPPDEMRTLFLGDRSRMDSVASLVELLHRRVRYTAVRLDASGLVPKRTTETLARGFGDCKDKGTVLVDLLRGVGLEADLALLRTGYGPDVDPNLPGMGLFDHAIVRVEGTPPIWIDATADDVRPGQLPPGVEGRRVLVLAPGREGLTRLPATTARENAVEDRFVLHLAERGPARAQVIDRFEGFYEAELRGQIVEANEQDIAEYFRDNALSRCGASRVDSSWIVPTSKRREPLTMGFLTTDARHFQTAANGANVSIGWSIVLDRLNPLVAATRSETSDPAASERVPRKADFWIQIPSLRTVRVEVNVPDGMAVMHAPAEQEIRMGPARLSIRPRSEPGLVRLEMTLDSGPRQWTPTELQRYRDVSDSLEAEGPFTIFFAVTGDRLRREGRFREALAEVRRLASAHPGEALHQEQFGDLMLEVGLGQAARDAARRGVVLEPKNPLAHRQLGYVLMHSPLGEWLKDGADLAGARVALARAVAMDTSDILARKWLAIAYQYNEDLVPRGPGSKLAESITQLLYLRDRLENRDLDNELQLSLAKAGRYGEILELRPPPETQTPDSRVVELFALAARDGVSAAVTRAGRKYRDDRSQLLFGAGALSLLMRRYPDASGLLDAAAQNSRDLAGLEAMRVQAKALTSLRPPPSVATTPEAAVHRLFGRLEVLDEKQLIELFAVESRSELKDLREEGTLTKFRRMTEAGGQAVAGFALDVMRTLPVTADDDGARGYRARISSADGAMQMLGLYLVPSGSELMILGAEGDPALLGAHAVRLIEKGELAAARKWLEWARDGVMDTMASDPAHRLRWDWWLRNHAGSERHRLMSAAAALVAGSNDAKSVLPILRERRTHAASQDERDAFDMALAFALRETQAWAECDTLVNRLRQRYPSSLVVRQLRAVVHIDQSQWAAVRKIFETVLAENPRDRTALEGLADIEAKSGRRGPGWNQWFRQLVADGRGSKTNYNNYAWEWIAQDAAPESALALARIACDPEESATAAALHTLAMALAGTGALAESKRVLALEMSLSGRLTPGSNEWLVLGRIASYLGEKETARVAYSRVEKDPDEGKVANSSWALAQRELAALSR